MPRLSRCTQPAEQHKRQHPNHPDERSDPGLHGHSRMHGTVAVSRSALYGPHRTVPVRPSLIAASCAGVAWTCWPRSRSSRRSRPDSRPSASVSSRCGRRPWCAGSVPRCRFVRRRRGFPFPGGGRGLGDDAGRFPRGAHRAPTGRAGPASSPRGCRRTDCGEGLAQPGPVPVGPGPAVVDVHPRRRHPKPGQRVALSGQILVVDRAPRVPDRQVVTHSVSPIHRALTPVPDLVSADRRTPPGRTSAAGSGR